MIKARFSYIYLLGDNGHRILYVAARLGWQQQLVRGRWEISSRQVDRSQIRSYCNIAMGHCSNIVSRQVHISDKAMTELQLTNQIPIIKPIHASPYMTGRHPWRDHEERQSLVTIVMR
jgi:hypothetical protein